MQSWVTQLALRGKGAQVSSCRGDAGKGQGLRRPPEAEGIQSQKGKTSHWAPLREKPPQRRQAATKAHWDPGPFPYLQAQDKLLEEASSSHGRHINLLATTTEDWSPAQLLREQRGKAL